MDIRLKRVSYRRSHSSVNQLEEISFFIPTGSFACLVGASGSGKSTLLECIAGLEPITSGECVLGNMSNRQSEGIRKKIGIVFQYPERQIFTSTVAEEIGYAARNWGLSSEDISQRVLQVLDWVGIPQSYLSKSPRLLSGGQMRRIALASALVMKPKILLLDEPTAGLDAKGTQELMQLLERLQDEGQMTVLMATHDMNMVGEYADSVIVLLSGQCVFQGTPLKLFSNPDQLQEWSLDYPTVLQWVSQFNQMGYPKLCSSPLTMEELVKRLEDWRRERDSQ